MESMFLLLILLAFVVFMFLQNKKRKKQTEDLQQKMLPGVEVMTSFGLFGVIVSLDDVDNKAVLDAGNGQLLTVHRQALAKIIESDVASLGQAEVISYDSAPDSVLDSEGSISEDSGSK